MDNSIVSLFSRLMVCFRHYTALPPSHKLTILLVNYLIPSANTVCNPACKLKIALGS